MATTFTVGDTAPTLSGSVNADLSGAAVEVHIRRTDRSVLVKSPTISDPANGAWSVSWEVGDLSSPGTHSVEAQVTFSNGRIQTFGPATFVVNPQIA